MELFPEFRNLTFEELEERRKNLSATILVLTKKQQPVPKEMLERLEFLKSKLATPKTQKGQ